MTDIQFTVSLDKIHSGELAAAQHADWMGKYLFGKVAPEDYENLIAWADQLSKTIRERVTQHDILAQNHQVAMSEAARREFQQKIKDLGFDTIPTVRTKKVPAKPPVIDILSGEFA